MPKWRITLTNVGNAHVTTSHEVFADTLNDAEKHANQFVWPHFPSQVFTIEHYHHHIYHVFHSTNKAGTVRIQLITGRGGPRRGDTPNFN